MIRALIEDARTLLGTLRELRKLRRDSKRYEDEDGEARDGLIAARSCGRPVFLATGNKRVAMPGGYVMENVHEELACLGQGCPIHHPSDHHMRDWPLVWRGDGPFDIWAGFERTCPHGVGHLDPDTEAWMLRTGQEPPPHGCDGCCRPPRVTIAASVQHAIDRVWAGD